MYDVKSKNAVEFIDDGEIRETLKYAAENKSNTSLMREILKKAAECKGLNHR